MGIEYFTIQIVVAMIACILGILTYTLGRYYYKDQSIKNLNDFLKTLDIDLIIEKLKFDNKFWKTAGVSMVASVIIVALVYSDLIIQIVPDEALLITAFKFFTIGIGMNFAINSLSNGGKLSSLIQAILTALLSSEQRSSQSKTQTVKTILQSNNVICHEVVEPNENSNFKTKTNLGDKQT